MVSRRFNASIFWRARSVWAFLLASTSGSCALSVTGSWWDSFVVDVGGVRGTMTWIGDSKVGVDAAFDDTEAFAAARRAIYSTECYPRAVG